VGGRFGPVQGDKNSTVAAMATVEFFLTLEQDAAVE
jgi:hypothetical protein